MAYQPDAYGSEDNSNLQQQKLKWLISLAARIRNPTKSTIVEIKMAYQPRNRRSEGVRSTIVEIKMAYQPSIAMRGRCTNLQQQKLKWLISPKRTRSWDIAASTIVEIKMAYQPGSLFHKLKSHLQQQKLKWLISLPHVCLLMAQNLQQQKLKWLISHNKQIAIFDLDLQQQKLKWLISQVGQRKRTPPIYNSRN